jgi:hypothetical protein
MISFLIIGWKEFAVMASAWPFYYVNFQIRAKVIGGIVQRSRKPYDIHIASAGYPRFMPRCKPAINTLF